LSYNQYDGYWEEVVTPFFEWRTYQRSLRDTRPIPIQHTSAIQRTHFHDFGFLRDLNTLLTALHNQPLSRCSSPFTDHDADSLTEKLLQCQLATQTDDIFYPSERARDWLQKHPQEQALEMYRMTVVFEKSKDLKEIEKCLKPIAASGWIYFEDFVNSCQAPIGNHLPVTLQKTGKKWKYSLPNYTEKDTTIFKKHVMQNLFHAGMVATGVHDEKPCFCVTSFGSMTLA